MLSIVDMVTRAHICFCVSFFSFSLCASNNSLHSGKIGRRRGDNSGRIGYRQCAGMWLCWSRIVLLLFYAGAVFVTKTRTCTKTMNWSFFVAKCLNCLRKSMSMRCKRCDDRVYCHLLDGRMLVHIVVFIERQPCCTQRTGLCPNIQGQMLYST